MSKKSKNNYKWLFVLGILLELLAIIYFALPLLLNTPAAFIVIKSDSMLPVLEKGDVIVVSGIDKHPNSFENEIIAFYDPTQGKIIVHRAIGMNKNCLITKGDNADMIDFFNPCKEYILGRVVMKV